jgi:holo-[acyl-carrier protein] synthase
MLIYGIGTDLVSKKRIARIFNKHPERFAARILSPAELSIFKHKQSADYLAKRFAAKEAVVKALGIGFREGIYFHNISILSDNLGKPSVSFHGVTQKYVANLGELKFDISISDDFEYALAFVVISNLS